MPLTGVFAVGAWPRVAIALRQPSLIGRARVSCTMEDGPFPFLGMEVA
jgi:hypothetical protein